MSHTMNINNFLDLISAEESGRFFRYNNMAMSKALYDFDGVKYRLSPKAERVIREVQALNYNTLDSLSLMLTKPLPDVEALQKTYVEGLDHSTGTEQTDLEAAIALLLCAEGYSGNFRSNNSINALRDYLDAQVFLPSYSFIGEKASRALSTHVEAAILFNHFLESYKEIDGREVKLVTYRCDFKRKLEDYSNTYNWCKIYSVDLKANETSITWSAGCKLEINVSHPDLQKLEEAGIDFSHLRLGGKRVIVGQIEDISTAEIEKAAKKIGTPVDTSTIKAYTITEGIKINNIRELSDYWHLMRISEEQRATYTTDLKGAVCVVIETPQSSYTTCATSLGRALASASKKVQGAVMDSLDLSF